ncbi:Acyl-CoA-binding protein ACBP [Macrophomina phaseolina MS6]|uniref:Acyl-CoA-binding protein ACBP n=2 Tax=Macrophomina phaseolina TaxID=35725 RepID=K2S0A2_MACPH|nr:Acyl-CoA-binding protein ACBP [Macrophomina phaseolina MS6]KAH7053211.1 putative fatty acid binding protein [Macrophomina phaseolina]
MPATEEQFKAAFSEVRNLAAQPTQDEQLDLYALAKIAQNEDIEQKKPGMFDIKGKTMRNHWQKKLDEGVTPEQARDQYVELVEKFKKTYGTK